MRVSKIFSSFMPLLTDAHPLVRDVMAETADLLVSNLFYHHAYEHLLPLVTRLIDLGINLDVNLARRWECRLALGMEEGARQDWESLKSIVKPWEPAPAQHSGLHTRYPNYDFWQLFGYLRVANAHMKWAEGGDPCEYLASRKKSLNTQLRDRHVQTAGEYVAVVQKQMEALVNECNAFEELDPSSRNCEYSWLI